MTHGDTDDPRCPECGDAVGATATYCLHCPAEFAAGGADDPTPNDSAFDIGPDGPVDDTLTAAVGVGVLAARYVPGAGGAA